MVKTLLLKGALLAFLLSNGSIAHAKVMLGVHLESDARSLQDIDKWHKAVNRKMATITIFTNFTDNWTHLRVQANNAALRDAVPIITWMPTVTTRPKANLLPEIIQGKWDNYIKSWIEGLQIWSMGISVEHPAPIMLRFGHEFNGNWYPWSNQPKQFRAAWQHVHKLFEAAGVNQQVQWVWCANNVDVDKAQNITQYYPGDRYVDWTALDGYNWGSNYSYSTWATFDQVFNKPYHLLVKHYPTKPIMIAEVSSVEPLELPKKQYGQDGNDLDRKQSKELWVANMFKRVQKYYPAIHAINWFNANKEFNWALTEPKSTGLKSYRTSVKNTYYQGTFAELATKKN